MNPALVIAKNQRGATLLISLVLLLLLTLLALAAARSATLQQRMAGNLQQQNLAFQAAESGIAAAILLLEDEANRPQAGSPKYLASDQINMVSSWHASVLDCESTTSRFYYCVRVEEVDCSGLSTAGGGTSSIGEGGAGVTLLGSGTCYTITSTGRPQPDSTALAVHQQGYIF